jgi:hypothetical protein
MPISYYLYNSKIEILIENNHKPTGSLVNFGCSFDFLILERFILERFILERWNIT